jgi:hypothetical protein
MESMQAKVRNLITMLSLLTLLSIILTHLATGRIFPGF